MKLQAILSGLILGSCSVQAQNMVSVSSLHPVADTIGAGRQELAIRYPGLRQVAFTASGFGYSDFDARLHDDNFSGGKIKTGRISTFVNTPALKWKGNSLSATIAHTYTTVQLKDIVNDLPAAQLMPLTANSNTFDLALNYSRAGSVFHHPVIYALVVRGISDGVNSLRRFNFNGSFNVPLKSTENTSCSVGLLVLIDPSSPIPVEPIVSYWHRFAASGIELIVDLPNGINVKKAVAKNAWLMIGSNQQSYSIFYNQHNAFLDGKTSYNTIELKSGAAFEYLFAKKIMLTVGGGINNYLSARVFKSGEDYSNASLISENKAVPYLNIGLSLLTF